MHALTAMYTRRAHRNTCPVGRGTAYAVQQDRANRQKKKGHMGIGLENVRRTLAVYHGTLQCEETGGEYRVSIMLPKKEEL